MANRRFTTLFGHSPYSKADGQRSKLAGTEWR
jgi:hypothetical protein